MKRTIVLESNGERLLEALWRCGIAIEGLCGGMGRCGKCRVRIIEYKGVMSKISSNELKLLNKRDLEKGYRLACMTWIKGTFKIEIEELSLDENIYTCIGYEPSIKFEPLVQYREVAITSLIRSTKLPLDKKLLEITRCCKYNLNVMNKFFNIIKNRKNIMYAIIHDNEIIDIKETLKMYGLGIDLGTTKIAISLVDLVKGFIITHKVLHNPQIKYGSDVVSRIESVITGRVQLEDLRNITLSEINRALSEIYDTYGINFQDVYVSCIAGNTVMTHLLLGVNPESIGIYPYTPLISRPLVLRNSEFGLHMNSNGLIYIMPCLAGYVGGDVIANLITTQIYKSGRYELLIDIGTNTEVILSLPNGNVLVTSAPAGSALEGVGIKCGVRAVKGAIDSVEITSNLEVRYTTIGNEKPIGITGTGLLDTIAQMLIKGLLDYSGKFRNINTERLRVINGVKEFVIVWKEESGTNNDIVITQRDIRLVQEAIAAIKTAWMILLNMANVSENRLSKIIIAGSFGSRLKKDTILTLNLTPRVNPERIVYLGNTVLSGTRVVLKSRVMWGEVRRLAEDDKVKVIELAEHKDFNNLFIKNLFFKNWK